MIRPIPNWLFVKYCKLWVKKNDSWFEFSEMQKILGKIKRATLSKIISDMKDAGWLETRPHPIDVKKRQYKLVPFNSILKEIAKAK